MSARTYLTIHISRKKRGSVTIREGAPIIVRLSVGVYMSTRADNQVAVEQE